MDELIEKIVRVKRIVSICSSYVFKKTDGEGYVAISKFPESKRMMFECYKNKTSRFAFASLTMQGDRILGFMDNLDGDFKEYITDKLN